jgi:hypothetical protein
MKMQALQELSLACSTNWILAGEAGNGVKKKWRWISYCYSLSIIIIISLFILKVHFFNMIIPAHISAEPS